VGGDNAFAEDRMQTETSDEGRVIEHLDSWPILHLFWSLVSYARMPSSRMRIGSAEM
jgi:hypothetical protein